VRRRAALFAVAGFVVASLAAGAGLVAADLLTADFALVVGFFPAAVLVPGRFAAGFFDELARLVFDFLELGCGAFVGRVVLWPTPSGAAKDAMNNAVPKIRMFTNDQFPRTVPP
jgi:hypothetical protein